MKKAFTLAEVLITIAIIGIVAALTIPALVSKNEKKHFYTQFMKSYNTLSNAINMSVADNGFPSSWTIVEGVEGAAGVSNKYLKPYLNVAKTCDKTNYQECFSQVIKNFNGEETELNFDPESGEISTLLLQDGSSIWVSDVHPLLISILVDTNGLKGPNTFGKDVFAFLYVYESFLGGTHTENRYILYAGEDAICPDENFDYALCGGRLLKEGAMNY